jgi:hypothetical protein
VKSRRGKKPRQVELGTERSRARRWSKRDSEEETRVEKDELGDASHRGNGGVSRIELTLRNGREYVVAVNP